MSYPLIVDSSSFFSSRRNLPGPPLAWIVGVIAHLGHSSLSLETSAHAVVDTLWLSPARVDAHEAVRLVAVEARSACMEK